MKNWPGFVLLIFFSNFLHSTDVKHQSSMSVVQELHKNIKHLPLSPQSKTQFEDLIIGDWPTDEHITILCFW